MKARMPKPHMCDAGCRWYQRPLHALGRWLVRKGWLVPLVFSVLMVAGAARADVTPTPTPGQTWTSPRSGVYLSKDACGRIVVVTLKDGKFLWHHLLHPRGVKPFGIRRGVDSTLAQAEIDAAVCQ